jgi:hypothetical protein
MSDNVLAQRFIQDAALCVRLGLDPQHSQQSLDRLEQRDPDFPQVCYIGGLRMRALDEVERYEQLVKDRRPPRYEGPTYRRGHLAQKSSPRAEQGGPGDDSA